MPRKEPRIPAYCHHKTDNRAYVRLNGKPVYLGRYDSPESKAEYERIIAEWLAAGRRLSATGPGLAVKEVLAAYWRFAERYYVKGNTRTSELHNVRDALRHVRRLYADTLAAEFGPARLRAVREAMIADGLCRSVINSRVNRIRRMFRWAVEHELIRPSVLEGLRAVAPLKFGRCEVREPEPVRPVPQPFIDAIRPHVSRQAWAMIELQCLTGMRSGEVTIMRACDIDMSGPLWAYKPAHHKTEHHGHERIIMFGPKAQAVIRPFLKPDTQAYLFSPADADAERRAVLNAKRKTPLSCGNKPGSNRKAEPQKQPRNRYDTTSYGNAIRNGCDAADAQAKKKLAEAGKPVPEDRIVPRWNAHRLRHNYATAIRKEHGIEIARIMLGHKHVKVSEVYAERDQSIAASVALKHG